MDHDVHHKDLMKEIAEEYSQIFENSKQDMYIYLDDDHKVCNAKFAECLGYASPEEWAGVTGSFPMVFVAEESQEALVDAYQKAMEESAGSQVKVTWKKKNGETMPSTVIIVPISYNGHLFALHFISH